MNAGIASQNNPKMMVQHPLSFPRARVLRGDEVARQRGRRPRGTRSSCACNAALWKSTCPSVGVLSGAPYECTWKDPWLFWPFQNVPKSDHRAPQKLSTKQSRSNKYAGADSEVQKACCEAWGTDFEDFELHGILPI